MFFLSSQCLGLPRLLIRNKNRGWHPNGLAAPNLTGSRRELEDYPGNANVTIQGT